MISRSNISIDKNFSARNQHCWTTNLHFLNVTRLPFHVEIDAAGPVNEIALLDDEFIPAVLRLETQTAVMNEIPTERPASTARRRVFGNVIGGREESRVRSRGAHFHRLARERMTARAAVPSVNVAEERCVNANVAQICE